MNNYPDEWDLNKYKLSNQALGVEIWIANGCWFCEVLSHRMSANLYQKWRLWRSCKRVMERKLTLAFTRKSCQ